MPDDLGERIEHGIGLIARHILECRHGTSDRLHIARGHVTQHLPRLILAQRHQQHGGTLTAGQCGNEFVVRISRHLLSTRSLPHAPPDADPRSPYAWPVRLSARIRLLARPATPPLRPVPVAIHRLDQHSRHRQIPASGWLPGPAPSTPANAATVAPPTMPAPVAPRSEEHTSELQSLMRIS